MKNRLFFMNLLGILGIVILIFISSKYGYIDIDLKEVAKGFFSKGKEGGTNWYIVHQVRLPRIMTSLLVGGILSMCGLIFQGVLLNPLANPYTLGISGGASFGAGLALVLNITIFGIYSPSVLAFIFGGLSLVLVLKVGSIDGKIEPIGVILGGIIIGSFFSAGLTFLKYIADDEVGNIIFWLLGGFSGKSWNEVGILLIAGIIGVIIFYIFAEELNILALGEKNAISLGIDPMKIRIILLGTGTILSSLTVAICGIIGFVGLVVPHIIRTIVGTDNKKLIITSLIWGGFLMLIADNIVRVILPNDIPVGIITSLLGAPFFALVFKKKVGGRS